MCTVTLLYSVSSTVQGWIDNDPPGVRGARVGNGLLDECGVFGSSGRLRRPGVDSEGEGAGAGVVAVGALARRPGPGPGVAGGSMAPRGEPCSGGGGSAVASLMLFSCLVLAEDECTEDWIAVLRKRSSGRWKKRRWWESYNLKI